jgi:hypothetical protein
MLLLYNEGLITMAYTKLTWTATTRVSAQHLNNLETQYDEVMSTETTWNNHDSIYYPKTSAITTFFNTSFMGSGSGADADKLDGHHASDLLGTGLPVGAIVWWDSESIPAGWNKCDGTNGTADYKDRFVVGSSATLVLKSLYGAASVTPTTSSVTIGTTALDSTTIPAHTHSYSDIYCLLNTPSMPAAYVYYYGYDTHSYYYNGTSANRTTGSTGSGTAHGHTGSTVTWNSEANIPPYYALYLIKRLS